SRGLIDASTGTGAADGLDRARLARLHDLLGCVKHGPGPLGHGSLAAAAARQPGMGRMAAAADARRNHGTDPHARDLATRSVTGSPGTSSLRRRPSRAQPHGLLWLLAPGGFLGFSQLLDADLEFEFRHGGARRGTGKPQSGLGVDEAPVAACHLP